MRHKETKLLDQLGFVFLFIAGMLLYKAKKTSLGILEVF